MVLVLGEQWLAAQLRTQKGRCHWCGLVMNVTDRHDPRYRSVDHLIERCKGGPDTPDNCVLACRLSCNSRRSAEARRAEAGQSRPDTTHWTPEQRVRYFLGFPPR